MNVTKLEVGMTFNKYKELCDFIEEPLKEGNSKKYQLIDWERNFRWEKKGHKFIITEVFEEAELKINNYNRMPFIEEMEYLLIDLLLKNEKNTVSYSNSKLMLELCMVNPNYHKYLRDKDLLSELISVDLDYIIDFYDTTSDTFKNSIQSLIKSLESKRLVKHQHIYMVNVLKAFKYKKYNKDVLLNEEKTTYRMATDKELERIIYLESELLAKYRCSTVQDVIKKGIAISFYDELNSKILGELGIFKYHKEHRFSFNKYYLNKRKLKLLSDNKIEELKDGINLKVMIRIDENSNKRYNKAMEQLLEFEMINNKEFRTNDDYVDTINHISSTLIDKNI